MFRSIGLVIVLYFLVSTFAGAFAAFEEALVATFATIQTAAEVSQDVIRQQQL